jgi:hypothetical protein
MGLRRGWTGTLALFVLCALLVSQAAYFGANHHHDGSGHCCTLCHVRNVPPLQALAVFRLPQPVLTEWAIAPGSLPAATDPLAIATSSRSPPA